MAREEQNTQQPTGGKGPGFHRKKQNISKGELPKQKGARGIIVEEKLKTMDEVGQSLASKNRKRPCSGLSEEEREKWQNEDCQRRRKKKKMPIDDDFIELDDLSDDDIIELGDLTSFNTTMFGSVFDDQSPTIGGEEAVMNKSPHQYKIPTEDFIALDDLTSFNNVTNESLRLQNIEEVTMNEDGNQDAMPTDDFIGLDDLTSFNTTMFGSSFDGQSPTIGGEEAVMNKSPDKYKFGSSFDGQASVLGRKEAAMNEPPVQYKLQWEDYNDPIKCSSKSYSLNKLENKIIKLNKDHSN